MRGYMQSMELMIQRNLKNIGAHLMGSSSGNLRADRERERYRELK